MRINRLSLLLLLALAGCPPTEEARSLPANDEDVRLSADSLLPSPSVEPLVLPSASAASTPTASAATVPPPSASASSALPSAGAAMPATAHGSEKEPVIGQCGPIPETSFYIQHFHPRTMRATARWPFANLEQLDFDGDGTTDVMVPQPPRNGAPNACPHDIEWDLYLRRKACGGVYAGRVRGFPEKVSERFGRRVLQTSESNVGPMRNPTTFRYVLYGAVFRHSSEHTPSTPTRCEVHPADCISLRCQLAGHPRGGFDYLALERVMRAARKDAEQCASKVTTQTRCNVDLLFSPTTGKARIANTNGCGAAEACVRAAFDAMQVSPYTTKHGEQTAGLSFTLPP